MIKKSLIAIIVVGVFCSISSAYVISDFDDLSLSPDSHWSGDYPEDGDEETFSTVYFESGTASYENHSNGDGMHSWGGFAYSNETDTETEGYGNQYSSYAGNAQSGSNFAVGYMDTYNDFNPRMVLDSEQTVSGLYVTNTTYTALTILNGDNFIASPFEDGDWFKLTIEGFDNSGSSTGTVDFNLANYRSGESYIADSWEYIDLTTLDTVKSLEFTVDSSDVGQYGINTPKYFAIDTVVPEPGTIGILGLGLVMLRKRRV